MATRKPASPERKKRAKQAAVPVKEGILRAAQRAAGFFAPALEPTSPGDELANFLSAPALAAYPHAEEIIRLALLLDQPSSQPNERQLSRLLLISVIPADCAGGPVECYAMAGQMFSQMAQALFDERMDKRYGVAP
jgi:hypothetical protein